AEHQRRHRGKERPRRCRTCGETFRFRGNLLEHRRRHLGERVYRCERCGKSFFYLGSIARHLRGHERRARCPRCRRSF
ncbi:zinc finger protein 865-like, partial [Onychostruthus taczanowskii]|uniref:zinc finger protein 865-like n=1 Tax=Onychostruthus taczanowskii TaxID=356909 RepID=UPI001B800EAF